MTVHVDDAEYTSGKLYGELRTSIGARVFSTTFGGPAFLDRYTRIGPDVATGRYVAFGENTSVIRSTIGSFVACGNNVAINPFNHPTDWLSIHEFQFRDDSFNWVDEYRDCKRLSRAGMLKRVVIGNDVWIGHGAMVLGDVSVGDGAIIAANAVVNRYVPPYAIVAGVPAKVKKFRFDDRTISRLLRLQWWQRPLSELSGLPFDRIDECLDILEHGPAQNIDPQLRQDHLLARVVSEPTTNIVTMSKQVNA